MNDLSNYILEKLHIDKDTNVDTPLLENMIEVLKCFNYNDKKDNSNEVIDVLSNWLGTYNKHLYFYCPNAFYKFCGDLEYNNLSLMSVKDTLIEKVKDNNEPKEVYSKGGSKYFISKITQTEYDLIIYHNNLYTPIIFEKTKI